MNKAPAFQFYVKDWLSMDICDCSMSTKGIWIDMLCKMWVAPIQGELEFFSWENVGVKMKASPSEIELFKRENELYKFCYISVTCNGIVTIRNRRMYRLQKEKKNTKLRVREYRKKRKCNNSVTPPSSTASSSAKKKEIKKKVIFRKPTLQEVTEYCLQRNNGIDPQYFLDSNETKGWKVGKTQTPMKDWQAAIRTWENNKKQKTVLESVPEKKIIKSCSNCNEYMQENRFTGIINCEGADKPCSEWTIKPQ